MKKTSLLKEEERTTIWFFWIFYLVYFVYDMFYYDFFPTFPWFEHIATDLHRFGFFYSKYIAMIGIIPLIIFWVKRNKTGHVKYVLFATYLLTNLITDIFYFKDSSLTYTGGNLVELVVILFSPIFVNKRFFHFVTWGLISKYILTGLILQDPIIMFPVAMIIILSFIAYILLNRFLSFIKALKLSYDEQFSEMTKGIITALELKDPYTRGHSERVAAYALNMAKATGLYRPSELRQFYNVCLLHDIGKVQVPDSILTKAGKLTDEEYELIKTHAVVGAKALQDVEGIEDYICVVKHHHERWDGKGTLKD